MDTLIFRQIDERQGLQQAIAAQRDAAQDELLRLRADVARYQSLDREEPEATSERDSEDDEPEGPDRPERPRLRRRRGFD